jgi:selenocysteine lyase/cysteine desulfurase
VDVQAYRAEFPITERYAFLNHAAVSAPGLRVTEAVREHVERTQRVPLDMQRDELDELTQSFKERVAALICAARPDEVVPMVGTAMGINTAANSLPLRTGENVLVLEGDYPAVIYPWLNLAPKGVLTKWAPQRGGGLDLDVLESRIDSRTRAIALSTAMFSTGYRNEIAAVGRLCRERGIYFVVDGIQTLGAFGIDVQACGIDFLACGSHKWLLGLPGSGFLYCRHELLDELQLGAYVGAFSTVDPWNFLDYNFTLHPTSERFNLGTSNFAGMVALHASLGLLREAGMGRISERVLFLTDALIADLQVRGYSVLSNLSPEHRSGIVVVEAPDPQAAYERLLDSGVVTSVRGTGLRISPHFYNTEEDVLRVGEVLGSR